MRRLAALWLLAALPSACRGEVVGVFEGPDARVPPIDSCERAFREGFTGAPCVGLAAGCRRERGCCVDEAYCDAGRLYLFDDMCDACGRCALDQDCAPGRICLAGAGFCVDCPGVPECPPCPPALVPVTRNGCETCECMPPSQCGSDEDCGDPALARCVPGAVCVCDEPGTCCANACASATCRAPGPPPEGCVGPCDEPGCPTGLCRRLRCACDADAGVCDLECAVELDPSCPPPP